MIIYRIVDESYFPQYDAIPMRLEVTAHYAIEKANRGLGGFRLVKTPVTPYVKDFCVGEEASVQGWRRFNLSAWGFFMAFDGERPVGAAAVASRDKEVNMLCGRDDLAVLWDIRVDGAYKGQGIGQALFDMAADWSRSLGLKQMKIECQNNNVPAVNFYHKQGAALVAVDEYAYYDHPQYRREAQMIWMLDL